MYTKDKSGDEIIGDVASKEETNENILPKSSSGPTLDIMDRIVTGENEENNPINDPKYIIHAWLTKANVMFMAMPEIAPVTPMNPSRILNNLLKMGRKIDVPKIVIIELSESHKVYSFSVQLNLSLVYKYVVELEAESDWN